MGQAVSLGTGEKPLSLSQKECLLLDEGVVADDLVTSDLVVCVIDTRASQQAAVFFTVMSSHKILIYSRYISLLKEFVDMPNLTIK